MTAQNWLWPYVVYINGKPVPEAKVAVEQDVIRHATMIDIHLPHLDMYGEFLKSCEAAPTLDKVMFNWNKEVP